MLCCRAIDDEGRFASTAEGEAGFRTYDACTVGCRIASGSGRLYEVKLDGYRALVLKQRRAITLFSRGGNNLTARFPGIARAFSFLPENTIVDGELVVLDREGKPSFSALQNLRFTPDALYFYVFDLIALAGRDLRRLPFVERRRLLEHYALKGMLEPVRLSLVFTKSPKRLIAAAKESGLEGVIAKRADSRYESGERSGAWVKFKTNKGQELVVGL